MKNKDLRMLISEGLVTPPPGGFPVAEPSGPGVTYHYRCPHCGREGFVFSYEDIDKQRCPGCCRLGVVEVRGMKNSEPIKLEEAVENAKADLRENALEVAKKRIKEIRARLAEVHAEYKHTQIRPPEALALLIEIEGLRWVEEKE